METVVGFIIVSVGGEYSDKYHYNRTFFLDRQEAEVVLQEEQKRIANLNKIMKEARDYLSNLPTPWPNNEELVELEKEFPRNTPNRRAFIAAKHKAIIEKRSQARIEKYTEFLTTFYPDYANLDINPQHPPLFEGDQECDWEIEEIDIPIGSRLYQLLCYSR